ncbi:nephrin-like isoform X2 [Mercenaria mercenaria]|uniref:nephrin-like isoform X2 n=1 Tax=Mercenaria mercenaria TaxID=6596 RepID=UPI00234F3444|nr:nephrin-like isoform X2 [Mercenaria mercenaria]
MGKVTKELFLILLGALSVTALDVTINTEVTIICPLSGVEYPDWTGPTTLATPLTSGENISEPGIEWVGKKDLKILSAQTKHTGQYTCSKDNREGLAEPINVLTYDVTVTFLNVDVEEGMDTERLIGEIDQKMNVTCQVNGGNPAPTVTLAFDDDVTAPPEMSPPLISEAMTEENTYSVNATVTFNANGSVDYKHIVCSASYQDKNSTDKKVLIYLLRRPLLNALSISKYPSLLSNQMEATCDTTSRPETKLDWIIGGKNITESELDVVENYQGCTQDSTTYIFTCKSNITIDDIKKEDNGKEISCGLTFQGETSNSPVAKINLPFRATNVTITGNNTGVVDSGGSVTLTLTCATDAANPAETLRWYIGTEKREVNSTYPTVEVDEMYNGKNVSQKIDIVANRTMNDEQVSCCAYDNFCTDVILEIQYPPELLAPQLSEYRAYAGDNISIPCIADSSPAAHIAWYRMEDQNSTHISNNTDDPSNVFYLQIVNISNMDATDYICKAWSQLQDVSKAVSKSTKLTVFDKPAEPVVETTVDAEKYYIEIKTSASAPDVPRKFYIQYRKVGEMSWREVSTGYEDTLPGQESTTYSHGFKKSELEPDSDYEFRVKSVDDYGLVSYSSKSSIRTEKEVVSQEDDMVSMTKYRNAIIISVFATAAVFLIILVVITCALKNGKCASSSSKSYVM